MLHMFKILLINNVQQYKCSGVVDVSSWTCTLGGAHEIVLLVTCVRVDRPPLDIPTYKGHSIGTSIHE